jgi:hypothetical protein
MAPSAFRLGYGALLLDRDQVRTWDDGDKFVSNDKSASGTCSSEPCLRQFMRGVSSAMSDFTVWVLADKLWHIAKNTYPNTADVFCSAGRVKVESFVHSGRTRFWDLEGGSFCQDCIDVQTGKKHPPKAP